jgi:hypothetical protein
MRNDRRACKRHLVSVVSLTLGMASCVEPPPPPPLAESLTALVMGEYKIETNLSGQAYVDDCRARGVPVPDMVVDPDAGWAFSFDNVGHPFVRPDLAAELWVYEAPYAAPGGKGSIDGTPPYPGAPRTGGVCMAMPRIKSGGGNDFAASLNLICMARTGETCFFAHEDEEDAGPEIPPVVEFGQPITSFKGGTDLVGGPGGACSDCHIGDNPFIVHPLDPAFAGNLSAVSIFPSQWPKPVVPASFPGNPPPIEALAPLSPAGAGDCNQCHGVGSNIGGRLPQVSSAHPQFCNMVLQGALTDVSVGPSYTPPTMPPGATITTQTNQTEWLFDACQSVLGTAQVIRFDPPPGIEVFPPRVVSPYACTRFVTVTDVIPGAQLELYAGTMLLATETVTDPVAHVFEVASPWVTGQALHVMQSYGSDSADSGVVFVRDHKEDYPDGLPPPTITPTPIYECATKIAVHNAPGATIEVLKTDTNNKGWTRTRTSGTSHSWMDLSDQGPFDIGDAFVATQTICNDESDPSPGVVASAAPDTIDPIAIAPPIVGQHVLKMTSIVQGARVTLDELPSLSIVDVASWPFRHLRLDLTNTVLGPVSANDQLSARQELCGQWAGKSQSVQVLACDNDTLETFVPEIAPAHAGNDHIVVIDAVPGALMRVFDAGPVELGNGGGPVVHLSRPLVKGETILVTQQLLPQLNGNGCVPNRAYVIIVN